MGATRGARAGFAVGADDDGDGDGDDAAAPAAAADDDAVLAGVGTAPDTAEAAAVAAAAAATFVLKNRDEEEDDDGDGDDGMTDVASATACRPALNRIRSIERDVRSAPTKTGGNELITHRNSTPQICTGGSHF